MREKISWKIWLVYQSVNILYKFERLFCHFCFCNLLYHSNLSVWDCQTNDKPVPSWETKFCLDVVLKSLEVSSYNSVWHKPNPFRYHLASCLNRYHCVCLWVPIASFNIFQLIDFDVNTWIQLWCACGWEWKFGSRPYTDFVLVIELFKIR